MAANGTEGYAPTKEIVEEEARPQLTTTLSRTSVRYHSSQAGAGLSRTFTEGSRIATRVFSTLSGRYDVVEEPDVEEGFELLSEVKETQAQADKDGHKPKRLGVTWRGLTVKGVGADAAFNENVSSQFDIISSIREGRKGPVLKTIINNSNGNVKPGEMLLVLGRPGAGCTTLLKMLSNRREGYAEIEGDVFFGSMTHKETKNYRGQVVMNTEDELYFPTLTVGETIDFATRMKVPYNLPSNFSNPEECQQANRDFLLKSLNISHTISTKVGDEYVRGVSGGERKRVSIIETLATRASVFCWDNSTRGLDASTALQYTRAIRALSDVFGMTSIVTLYQAGNGIYNLFEKVLVLEQGEQIYFGPRTEARAFLEGQGFFCDDAANIADFLTGVCVPTERQIRPGFEHRFPRTSQEIRSAYDATEFKTALDADLNYPDTDVAKHDTLEFKESVKHDKHKSLPKNSVLTVSFPSQVSACIKRQFQIIWGDKPTLIIKQASTIIQAFVLGSLFYKAPDNSAGLFIKGGTLFYAVLYPCLVAMSETTDSFAGRPVMAKHRGFALYHPAAFCISQIVADLPLLFIQTTVFGLVLYFLVGLTTSAGAFFTFWIVTFMTGMTVTAFFRAIGAAFPTFEAASKVSGFVLTALLIYNGFMIPVQSMKVWFSWMRWVNPLYYAFGALMGNEFKDKMVPCVFTNLVPSGPSYRDVAYQSCAGVAGSRLGSTFIFGEDYLEALSFSSGTVWRNFGILCVWWVLFAALTIWATSNWTNGGGSAGHLLLPRELMKQNKKLVAVATADEESQVDEKTSPTRANSGSSSKETVTNGDDQQLIRNSSVFTWKNLTYTVQTPSGPRVLLDNVQGWVKPGSLGALMGSSGAGKTTLLDVLAQRKTDGTIEGAILVDGRPLSVSFQRSAGYCEQLDVHEPLTTVREALEFSALLRQSRDTPREEKLKYVDTIINLLELRDIENTLVGKPGAGLSIEQRKRLTIGVELVAKPSILIFLDEPTSGLDGSAAFNTVRFLRKLADVGQAILVTIHQPSASLFAQFDNLLLLAKGGKTVYFGEIGENAATIKDYFARYDAVCPADSNPAEHMIDVVSGSLSKGRDWNKVWLESPEHEHTVKQLDSMVEEAASKPSGTIDDGREFATSLWVQTRLVTNRMNVSLYRNVDYINNKLGLHIGSALFNGFSFWKLGNGVADLQLKMFTIFNFIFVAPGVIAQLQPLFIERRDVYETREKKAKMYSWKAFVTGLIISELPYLAICAALYYVCWYYTVGFPGDSSRGGAIFFIMLFYEFVYTGIGQSIAAYAPNAVFASLVNPVIIGVLVAFCGVLVPYSQIPGFWQWLYYLNPFNYLMGGILTFAIWDTPVTCRDTEFAVFNPPPGSTCASYLVDYLAGAGSAANLVNPNATEGCQVCQYRNGNDYLRSLNLNEYYYGWRDAGIVVLFTLSSYACVFLLMKLRTKATKKAEGKA